MRGIPVRLRDACTYEGSSLTQLYSVINQSMYTFSFQKCGFRDMVESGLERLVPPASRKKKKHFFLAFSL